MALASADETTAKRVASLVGDANGARGHMQGLVNGTVRARESINARPGAVLRIFEQKTMDKVGSNPGQTGVGK